MTKTLLSLISLAALMNVAACAEADAVGFTLPEPTGPYAIGATELTLVDPTRSETLSRNEADRRLTITVWYPAEPTGSEPLRPYLGSFTAEDLESLRRQAKLPPGAFDEMEATDSHAWLDAPVLATEGGWPVLLHSHGYGAGVPELYGSTTEELASHGYVVVSINHPYESAMARFDDGQEATMPQWKLIRTLLPVRRVQRLMGLPAGPEKDAETRKVLDKVHRMNDRLSVWVEDSRFVLDVLEDADAGAWPGLGMMEGHLDLDRVGAIGHSFGGATAVALSLEDGRVDAVVNADGFQFGDVYGRTIPVPALLLESVHGAGVNDMIYAASPHVEVVTDDALTHMGLADVARFSDLPERAVERLTGEGDAAGRLDAATAATLQFMDVHLAR